MNEKRILIKGKEVSALTTEQIGRALLYYTHEHFEIEELPQFEIDKHITITGNGEEEKS